MLDLGTRRAAARAFVLPALLAGCADAFTLFDAPPPEEEAARIRITADYTFLPGEVEVPVGGKVIWTNDSLVLHRILSDPLPTQDPASPGAPGPFQCREVPPGGSYQCVLVAPGTYRYTCPDHASVGMAGRIIVRKKGSP